MASKSELKRIYFYNDRALIVDKSAKEYCYVSDRLGILKAKDMIGFFICHENLTEKENQLKNQKYKQVASMIDRYSKL
ncbi:hypothetical protein [Enterococcus casseliflavus]|uniref:hypothetical protein n=1 Tax=Enterococcus TaxID=1350 RepID=UPI00232F6815|nr:hypothetical protein [Enterococcus casseliflavus]MDB1689717.1 hypothetical protein [Enterococcus casseliflavus]